MASQLSRSSVVLDSWPVLEWIKNREPAVSQFHAFLEEFVIKEIAFEMTRINYAEVIYTIRKAPDIRDRAQALSTFLGLPMRIHSIDDRLVDEATDLKSTYSFSFADAFAAALTRRLDVPVVTGDGEFRQLEADGVLALAWVGA